MQTQDDARAVTRARLEEDLCSTKLAIGFNYRPALHLYYHFNWVDLM